MTTTWEQILKDRLKLYGHRNWVVIADSAYPAQSKQGIETIAADDEQATVVERAFAILRECKHLRPAIYTDDELRFVPEEDAPGVTLYRSQLARLLREYEASSLPHEEIIATLHDQVKAGKIRYFGCSNWQTTRIKAANDYAKTQGVQGFVANQPLWNIGVIDYAKIGDPTLALMDEALWQYHSATGLAAIPYSSQANGLFNKMAEGKPIRPTTLRIYHNPQNQQRFQRIQQLAQTTALSVTQIVLGYLIAQPFTTIPIVGCQTMAQLADSLSAGDVRLTVEQVKFLGSD